MTWVWCRQTCANCGTPVISKTGPLQTKSAIVAPPQHKVTQTMLKLDNALTLRLPTKFGRIIGPRMRGPGGLYNMGNLLGLVAAVLVQSILALREEMSGADSLANALITQFSGSPSAVALTIAMLVFFWSGEAYHQAWSQGLPPDARLNHKGDVLSGIGAVALGVGLLITGHPMLAATAGFLHALGKFGSAYGGHIGQHLLPAAWPDLWRSLVLASRIPALTAAMLALWAEMMASSPGVGAITPLALILSNMLWMKADIALFRK